MSGYRRSLSPLGLHTSTSIQPDGLYPQQQQQQQLPPDNGPPSPTDSSGSWTSSFYEMAQRRFSFEMATEMAQPRRSSFKALHHVEFSSIVFPVIRTKSTCFISLQNYTNNSLLSCPSF